MSSTTTFLGKHLHIQHPQVAEDIPKKLLELREVDDTEAFLRPNIDQLHDPFFLPDMQVCVDRILQAKQDGERVMIFGDYDADGVTSTAALFLFLKNDLGLDVSYRIPHRIDDGYGLKDYFVDEIAQTGTTLLITVDCGTRDLEVISYAKEKGLDVIVTDHHAPGDTLPTDALAVVNPHRSDSNYPFKDLSGSGVVLKLIQAVSNVDTSTPLHVDTYLDICSIGTIADVMPLVGENRVIASLGLEKMRNSQQACFKHLVTRNTPLDADFVGYQIGPLINAAGRMDSPLKALHMFLAGPNDVVSKIDYLKNLNEKRKALSKKFYEEARQNFDTSTPLHLYTYVGDIPHGIIGLVAGKLCEEFGKPTIILASHCQSTKDEGRSTKDLSSNLELRTLNGEEKEVFVGSCRSPSYLNITSILEKHADMFVSFGGHAQAAGFTVEADVWPELEEKLTQSIQEATKGIDTTQELAVDFPLDEEQVSLETLGQIEPLAPFGVGNSKPRFLLPDLPITGMRKLGSEEKHLKINNSHFDILGWNWGEHYDKLSASTTLSIIGELEKNEWNGKQKVQVRLVDMLV